MNQNQKGKRVERELVHFLKEHGFASARRTEQYCGKAGTSDVECKELSDFHIESKGVKDSKLTKSQVNKWYSQLEEDCPIGKTPILFCKANGKDWVTLVNRESIIDFFPSFIFYPLSGDSFNPTDVFEELDTKDSLVNIFKIVPVEKKSKAINVLAFKCGENKGFLILKSVEFIEVLKKYNKVKKEMIDTYTEIN